MEIKVLEYSKKKENKILEEIKKNKSNIIIDFKNIDIEHLTKFDKKIELNEKCYSIVFVFKNIDKELHKKIKIPLIPTKQEAKDFIEMEEIQKQL